MTNNSVLARFLSDDFREVEIVRDRMASWPAQLVVETFEFNIFRVIVDKEQGLVTVSDVLEGSEAGKETVELAVFLERLAAAIG